MASRSGSATEQLRQEAREVLASHWRSPGFTCPNSSTYPWLWLWDSCFHAIVWAELGDADRALSELGCALGGQDADGFVPHLRYLDGSTVHEGFWGRAGSSSITQPPVFGHTVAELSRRGVEVPDEFLDRSVLGLRFLLERRRRSPAGLVEVVHPWETGCDHSPRWDDLMTPPGAGVPRDPFDQETWFRRKGQLLESVNRSVGGAPLSNDEFRVGSVAFTALVAFGADELGRAVGESELCSAAGELAEALSERWEPDLGTWVDDGLTAAGSGRTRTLEALLPLLVSADHAAVESVESDLSPGGGFGGDYGPPQVHRDEPTHRRGSYWRGPSWPQLDYLIWVALCRSGRSSAADALARSTVAGAQASGLAEYWDPDDARPGGACPQSWSTLAVCMSETA
jgi:hypothetical protein